MNVIIASDIFGITPSLAQLEKSLAKSVEVAIFDPYHGEIQNFTSQEAAYQEFLDEGGLESYTEQLKIILTYIEQPLVMIGFSAGASALWQLIDKSLGFEACHFIGFYPGQIRHHLDVVGDIPSTLIFPHSESHFDLDEVMAQLRDRDLLTVKQTPWGHGFVNPLSPHFDQQGAAQFTKLLSDGKLIADPAEFNRRLDQKKPSLLLK